MVTAKQMRFVEAYVAGSNATQAAIHAGYSPRTARSIASENLKKREIIEAIEHQSTARRKKLEAAAESSLAQLKRIAFSNIQDLFDSDGNFINPSKWTREQWETVKRVKYKETLEAQNDGSSERVAHVISIEMRDSLKALDILAEYTGVLPRRRRR